MSYGVVPSRHIVLALTIRGLRPRLPSLRSVVPSRHKSSYTCTFGGGSERTEICFLARALRIIFPEKPFNPALIRITACNQTGCECIVCTSNPSLMKGCVLSCNRFIYMQRLCFPGKNVHIHAPFLGIFGYARHSPNKFLKIRLLTMAKIE